MLINNNCNNDYNNALATNTIEFKYYELHVTTLQ